GPGARTVASVPHPKGDGNGGRMDARGGNSSRGRHQSAAVQYLPRSARPPDGAERSRDGEVRGRFRHLVPERGGSSPSAGASAGLDGRGRTATASGKDADGRRHAAGRIRLPGLPLRTGHALASPEEPGEVETNAARPDPAHERTKPPGADGEPQPDAAGLV